MPTIGEEQYDDNDRIPLRDVRGTPEQDALRRDLTIGAMLLRISRAANSKAANGGANAGVAGDSVGGKNGGVGGAVGGGGVSGAGDALAAADALTWQLLDYYDGLQDIRAGVLRSPYPSSRPLSEVCACMCARVPTAPTPCPLPITRTPQPP